MTVRIELMTCGWVGADLGMIVAGATGRIRLPVPSVLIEHPDGLALFDTGLHEELHRDTARLRSGNDLFRIEMEPGYGVGARLRGLGIDPADVRYVINSHLHFDHCGGNAELANAILVIQEREWQAGKMQKLIDRDVYNPADYDLGHEVMAVDGEHDLFADGSVLCVPTYGHTMGHQSLVVRGPHGEFVFTADTCYLRETLEQGKLPKFAYDRDLQRKSIEWVREKRDGGAHIVFGHDPNQWPTLAAAPSELTSA